MKLLRRFKLGEALLWLGFLFFTAAYMNGKDEALMLAGLWVLAAIGVRATRVEWVEVPNEVA